MRTACAILLAALSISPFSFAADEKPPPDAVVVMALDKPLPSETDKRERFLWDSFANKPDEQKFKSYTTENWKETYAIFVTALLKKADVQKLNSTSLRKALDLVLKHSNGEIAYLPVGAYQANLADKLVWIVTVKWEVPSMGDKGESVGLVHIRAFVFDQMTLNQVGFMTCM